MLPTIGIMGAGRVGTAIGVRLNAAGYPIGSVVCRSAERANEAVRIIGNGVPATDLRGSFDDADVVFICVPDRAIAGVAAELIAHLADASPGDAAKVLVHTSGALPAAELYAGLTQGRVPSRRGRDLGREFEQELEREFEQEFERELERKLDPDLVYALSMHPIQTIADRRSGAARLEGAYWGLEGDPRALDVGERLVAAMGGHPLRIRAGGKSLYHAAACVSSNYLAVLLDMALRLMAEAGVEKKDALPALTELMRGSVENARAMGLPDALTGPIERGDVETIVGHLSAIKGVARGADAEKDLWAEIETLYRRLGRYAVRIALEKHHQSDQAGHIGKPVQAGQQGPAGQSGRTGHIGKPGQTDQPDPWQVIETFLKR